MQISQLESSLKETDAKAIQNDLAEAIRQCIWLTIYHALFPVLAWPTTILNTFGAK